MAAEYPSFSLAERDRRWRNTRAAMDRAGMDVILFPCTGGHFDQHMAGARYLTQVGGNNYQYAAAFPKAGDPTVFIRASVVAEHWHRAQDWVTDIRGAGGQWGDALAGRVKELGLERGTIGVAGMSSGVRNPEGPAPYGTVMTLREQLPQAKLVDATELLAEQRVVKSEEEIDFMTRATALAERGIAVLAQQARPGMMEYEALAILQHAILAGGGELNNQVLWEVHAQPGRTWWHAYHRPMAHGDVIQNELEAKFCGYSSREVHAICLSDPDPRVPEMFRRSVEIFNDCMPRLKPGVPMGDIIARVKAAAEGTPYETRLTSYSRGLAEDGANTLDDPEAAGRVTYQENMAIMFKPVVRLPGSRLSLNFCATVRITPNGGVRLGHRSQDLIVVQ
jgi:Xaa-Pro dipeptidase